MTELRKAAEAALSELDLIQPQNMGPHVYRVREELRAALDAQPVAWDWLRCVMDGIPTREEFIGGQREKYVRKRR